MFPNHNQNIKYMYFVTQTYQYKTKTEADYLKEAEARRENLWQDQRYFQEITEQKKTQNLPES